jgi:hypothetical protein
MNLIDNDKIQAAQQLVTQVTLGDFKAVEQSLESGLRQQLPAEKLQKTWQSLQELSWTVSPVYAGGGWGEINSGFVQCAGACCQRGDS